MGLITRCLYLEKEKLYHDCNGGIASSLHLWRDARKIHRQSWGIVPLRTRSPHSTSRFLPYHESAGFPFVSVPETNARDSKLWYSELERSSRRHVMEPFPELVWDVSGANHLVGSDLFCWSPTSTRGEVASGYTSIGFVGALSFCCIGPLRKIVTSSSPASS